MNLPVGPLVVLVGPPGAGKSTVGALLADRLRTGFCDTDAVIEQTAGSSVAAIFVDHGEAYFRRLEEEAVLTALSTHDGVVALGGGAVTSAPVRERLPASRTVFLDVGLAEASRRVGLGGPRPLLLGNVHSRLRQLLAARHPLYVQVAGHVVSTDGRPAGAVADDVAALLGAETAS